MTVDPQWMTFARSHIGLREIPGPRHEATIQRWLRRLGAWWQDDETPWCGTFVAAMLQDAGLPIITHWMRARAWADYGANLRPDRLAPGAILVFWRGNPNAATGHVGFYVGEDASHYHVLGGNQANAVNVQRIAKGRLVASRWPRGVPVIGGPVRLSPSGAATSNGNEA
jgi:uncharacterized protein (TIGR02594 family)